MFRFAQHDEIPCVIASEQRERGNQRAKKLNTVDCFGYHLQEPIHDISYSFYCIFADYSSIISEKEAEMRAFILVLLASVMFAATAIQPVSNGKIEKIPESKVESVKKILKTLKKVTDSKERAVVSDIIINPTDEIYQVSLEGGSILMLLVTAKEQTSFLGDFIVRPPTFGLGKTLCAYNGMFYREPDDSQLSRSELNSAGGWFYFTKYPTSTMVIIERSSYLNNPSFRFTISRSGILMISRVLIADLTTDILETTKPIPLNEWVYIQGRQNGLEHSLGWKTASDGQSLAKRFAKDADAKVDVFTGSFLI